VITGFRCASCGAELDIATAMPWRCPEAGESRHHVLRIVRDDERTDDPATIDPNPFVAFGPRLAWWAFAGAHGMSDERRVALTRETDAAIARVCGTGFTFTPFRRHDPLSSELGLMTPGGVWVKDETESVGGSHKARHLMSILLHLLACEELSLVPWRHRSERPPLAIASCGNAAVAAATLAAAVDWPLVVFVPTWAGHAVTARLTNLGATLTVCPREQDDPPGDPTVHRFREAVAHGAIPFSVQGPENALCLDGGRTIGWEIAHQSDGPGVDVPGFDAVFVQVGGGAFATDVADALADGRLGATPLIAVQTEGCAPLARAWDAAAGLAGGLAEAAARWDECMWPWETEPRSLADGILDDETYDWLGVSEGMARTGGEPIVVAERIVAEAARLAPAVTGIDVSPTGAAGLAGVLAWRERLAPDARIAVIFSGVRR
jgi:threonine synthase